MKLLKNRTVLGLLCIAAALLICFVLTPLLNAGMSKKTTIVRFTEHVKAGEEIKKSMLQEVEVGAYNLPPDVLRRITEAEGKYLTTDVYAGDYLLAEKVSEEPAAENQYLYHLNGEKQAISITISSFAEGLSGKLKSGDIVSVIAPDYLGSGETVIPEELKYVEVIAVTAKSGKGCIGGTGDRLIDHHHSIPAQRRHSDFDRRKPCVSESAGEKCVCRFCGKGTPDRPGSGGGTGRVKRNNGKRGVSGMGGCHESVFV